MAQLTHFIRIIYKDNCAKCAKSVTTNMQNRCETRRIQSAYNPKKEMIVK